MTLMDDFHKEYNMLLNADMKRHPNMIDEFRGIAENYEYFDDFRFDCNEYANWVNDNIDNALINVIDRNPIKVFYSYYNEPYYDDFKDFVDEYTEDYIEYGDFRDIEKFLKDMPAVISMMAYYIHGTKEFKEECQFIIYDTKDKIFGDLFED